MYHIEVQGAIHVEGRMQFFHQALQGNVSGPASRVLKHRATSVPVFCYCRTV